jgi:hypothetical protein
MESPDRKLSREIQVERTTLKDGRYLIYYSFDPTLSPEQLNRVDRPKLDEEKHQDK